MEVNNQRIGLLILTAVAIIVGVVLLQASAKQVGDVTNTIAYANNTLGTMTNGTTLYVTSCRAILNPVIWNATGDIVIPANNYTITNNVVYNGALTVRVVPAVSVFADAAFNKGTATIDGTCEPTTYDESSGGRAVAGIIIVMFAIALAVVALTPTLKEKFF